MKALARQEISLTDAVQTAASCHRHGARSRELSPMLLVSVAGALLDEDLSVLTDCDPTDIPGFLLAVPGFVTVYRRAVPARRSVKDVALAEGWFPHS